MSDSNNALPKPRREPSPQVARIRRVRLRLFILAGVCFAWVALIVQLGMHGQLRWFQAPDWVYAILVFGPLVLGIALVLVARGLLRMVG